MRAALAALALTAGCALDFAQFRVPARVDASTEASLDAPRVDASPDRSEPGDVRDVVDARPGDVVDAAMDVRPPACVPGRAPEARVRMAHMAAGIGPLDLCMRRRGVGAALAAVAATRWPTAGVAYGQVTLSVPLNAVVSRANEAWDFTVVRAGEACAVESNALGARSFEFDQGVMRTLLVTSERTADGRVLPVLGLLADTSCTDCQASQVDVRGVHAALGAAGQRVSFVVEPQVPASLVPQNLSAMRGFASAVSYGGESGYACNSLWGAFRIGALTPFSLAVQLVAVDAAGSPIARSGNLVVKASLLSATRAATVFFEGDFDDDGGGSAGFVVCYDGNVQGNLSACDRVSAQQVTRVDAGPDAPVDVAPVDASNDTALDAGDASPDGAASDASVTDASLP